MCNLSEVVVRAEDDLDSLKRKVELATILGTVQSTFTDFKYLRKIWRQNCDEERLLGVSLTGVCDNLELFTKDNMKELREVAVATNKVWAQKLGINQSTAVSCLKPSGTVSQLVDAASGLHPRHSRYYLRTIRADNNDPITQFLKDSGVYFEADVMAPESTTVFYFPIEAPKGAKTRDDQTSLEALELWKDLQDNWCEHKPSATVSVKEDDWMKVGAWVYENFDHLSGVSFLPYDGGSYKQAPYQELSEEAFRDWVDKHPTPSIDWSKMSEYEWSDHTSGSQELACTGGSCEIVAIGREVG